MRIAIFDYQVTRTNPVGGCHRRMLKALANEHQFTVFSVAFDNPCPERIDWVRIPAPLRPLALLFVTYHLLAPLTYWIYRLRTGTRFDLVQTVESKLTFGSVAYTHFCHTVFLEKYWRGTSASGLRGFLRWLDHAEHALLEKYTYKFIKQVLVPSKGLAEELKSKFPEVAAKTRVLPNAVDVERLEPAPAFDSSRFRAKLGFVASDVVFCFIALGHFERKGLPLLLDAMTREECRGSKLLVIGGTPDLIEKYRRRVTEIGLKDRVVFAGMQAEVRPYLWSSDAFAFASTYETFSLVAFEAAGAGLPLITPLLHGIEEIVTDGQTGYVVDRNPESIASAFGKFIKLSTEERAMMGCRARKEAMKYNDERFVERWREFYREWAAAEALPEIPKSPAQPVRTC